VERDLSECFVSSDLATTRRKRSTSLDRHSCGALQDIFVLQDQVTSSLVAAITPRLEQEEIKRARRKPTEILGAYDRYLRGLYFDDAS
jgi:hypothetical protein